MDLDGYWMVALPPAVQSITVTGVSFKADPDLIAAALGF